MRLLTKKQSIFNPKKCYKNVRHSSWGSGIRDPKKTYPGSQGQKSTGSQIPYPQHCLGFDLNRIKNLSRPILRPRSIHACQHKNSISWHSPFKGKDLPMSSRASPPPPSWLKRKDWLCCCVSKHSPFGSVHTQERTVWLIDGARNAVWFDWWSSRTERSFEKGSPSQILSVSKRVSHYPTNYRYKNTQDYSTRLLVAIHASH